MTSLTDDDLEWHPYIQLGKRTTIVAQTNDGRIQLLQEGGAYVVIALRGPYTRKWEETCRGPAAHATAVFHELLADYARIVRPGQPDRTRDEYDVEDSGPAAELTPQVSPTADEETVPCDRCSGTGRVPKAL